ncbi:MAG TPA: hypothetical protein VMD59_20665 [Acidimicrobiales bacterium]|nr:hypothetical protein [Acidimicrobiales bacterium]
MALGADGKQHELPFSGYDPNWVNLPVHLKGRVDKSYGGLALYGPCPRCKHHDGINVFIPTTWATVVGAPAAGPQSVGVRALVRPGAASEGSEVEWEGTAVGGTGEGDSLAELVEVIVCHCGSEHAHQPPAGRSGCGYWGNLHLSKVPADAE